MKKIFAFVLCMMLCLSQMSLISAEQSENPLDWNFYSLSYAYMEGGVQKHYNPGRNTISDELIDGIRKILKDAVKTPTAEKPDDLGFRRIAVTFCNTDKPEEEGNDHIRYTYDLCDNGIRITKKNATWEDTPDDFVADLGKEFVETKDDDSATQYIRYAGTDYSRKIGELLNDYMGNNAVYPDFEFIHNLNFTYEASIFLHNTGSGSALYQWGVCTYELGGVPHTAAYLIDNAIYLAPILENNKVHFNGVTRFVPKTSGKSGLNGYFYESEDLKDTLSADLSLTLDENLTVTDLAFSVTDKHFPSGRTAHISTKDLYNADGTLRTGIDSYSYMKGALTDADGFTPSPKTEEPKEENKQEDTPAVKDEDKSEEEKKEEDKPVFGVPQTSYTDLSKGPKQKYNVTFSIPLTAKQEATWIGEFAENGKVNLSVTHFYFDADGSFLTVSGNGKSFHLMSMGEIYHNDRKQHRVWYSTTKIGVEKDTSLPHEVEKQGAISLNWTTGASYLAKDDLNVAIYDKPFVSENGVYRDNTGTRFEAATSPVGDFIPLTEKAERIDLTEEKETPVSPAPEIFTFTDVPETHWAHATVHKLYRAGIVRGVGENRFAPDSHMTYEHFAILLSRLFGYEAENKESAPATRQTVFTELVKAVRLDQEKVANENILSESFGDADEILKENEPYIKIAVEQGLVKGANGMLNPNGTLTRAECVTLLYRGLISCFGITEEDAPESYKFRLSRSENGYAKLNSDSLTYFRLNGEALVKSAERLKGRVMMCFGADALTSTRLVATCTVDRDVYTIETTSYEQLYFGSDTVFLRGYIHIYKNGMPHHTNAYMEILYDREEDTLTLRRGTNTRITFENVIKDVGVFPKTPAIQPYLEAEKENAQYNTTIYADIGLGLGTGRELDMGYDSDISGRFTIRYATGGKKAKVSALFTATDIHGLPNSYEIELTQATSVTDSEIAGDFRILKNGEELETTHGKLIGLSAGVGNLMHFVSDDGVWNIELTITEISK